MKLERQVVSALKWTASTKLLGQILSWIATLWVIRLLNPEDYGLMAIATIVLTITAGLAELGIGTSIVQARSLEPSELSRLAGLVIAFNLSAGVSLAALAPTLAAVFGEPRLTDVIRVCSLQFVFIALGTVASSLAARELAFRWLAITSLLSGVASSAATLLLAWLGAGVWALVWGPILEGALRTALLLGAGGWVRPSFRFEGMSRHIRFGGTITLSRMIWLVTLQTDIIIAGKILTPAAVGIYSVALHLATLPMQKIMGVVNQVAFPAVARLQDDLPRLRKSVLQAVNLLFFVSAPVLWGVSAVAPEFVSVFLGEKWKDATFPLAVISLVVPLRMVWSTMWTTVTALGQAEEGLRDSLINAIVFPACFLMGVQHGVQGLAVAWPVAMLIVMLISFRRLTRRIGIEMQTLLREIRGPALAGSLMWAAVHIARLYMGSLSDLARLPCLILIGAATYLIVATLLDGEIWARLRRIARSDDEGQV